MKKLILAIFLLGSLSIQAQVLNDSISKTEEKSLIQRVEGWYEDNMNYGSITVLMAVESSFIPFPSEVVIPPAAYIASKPDSKLNIFLVILFGTIGALLGAYVNYFLALWLGRPIVYAFSDSKLGRMLLLSADKVKKAEEYFNKHGNVSTFVGRLIPGIRQLISIPAGLAKMNFFSFSFYTMLGAGIWNSILALVGYIAHGQADLINLYNKEISMVFLAAICLAVVYFVGKTLYKRRKKTA